MGAKVHFILKKTKWSKKKQAILNCLINTLFTEVKKKDFGAQSALNCATQNCLKHPPFNASYGCLTIQFPATISI